MSSDIKMSVTRATRLATGTGPESPQRIQRSHPRGNARAAIMRAT